MSRTGPGHASASTQIFMVRASSWISSGEGSPLRWPRFARGGLALRGVARQVAASLPFVPVLSTGWLHVSQGNPAAVAQRDFQRGLAVGGPALVLEGVLGHGQADDLPARGGPWLEHERGQGGVREPGRASVPLLAGEGRVGDRDGVFVCWAGERRVPGHHPGQGSRQQGDAEIARECQKRGLCLGGLRRSDGPEGLGLLRGRSPALLPPGARAERGIRQRISIRRRLLQELGQLARAATLLGADRQHPQDEGVQAGLDVGIEFVRWTGAPSLGVPHVAFGIARVGGRWIGSRHQPVGAHPQGKHVIGGLGGIVGRRVVGKAAAERPRLRAAIGKGAWWQHGPRQRLRAFVVSGTEVRQDGLVSLGPHEHVVSLHVAVHRFYPVCLLQRPCHLGQHLKHLARGGVVLAAPRIQVNALDPVHHQIGVGFAGGVLPSPLAEQSRHGGVVKARQQLRLPREALVPGVEGQLQGHGRRMHVLHLRRAVHGAVGSSGSKGHHLPGADHRSFRQSGGIQRHQGRRHGHEKSSGARRDGAGPGAAILPRGCHMRHPS
ncbi:hypothetical protein STIAU_8144 [Stigmatella aurantiaca DW4/3-1]|uniref:Uncharacterized protein n=1 Tax=Stigmatella aurantiaca (strain DW4/3-1) TaxID=378806 RepID=Q08Z41_STIAD|nr:hypothetical protein STIAU_8144 [Stigmatella aurantiaca DW4/3-1]